MAVITIDSLAPGMILAVAVTDRSGRRLLAAGAEITQKHVRMLRTWGVLEVDVEGRNDDGREVVAGEISAEELKRAAEQLETLWRNVDLDMPMMKELFRLCVIRKARHDN